MADIQLILNFARSEKRNEGWETFHTGMGLSASNQVSQGFPKFQRAPLPPTFWKEPNTGVIMKRPLCLSKDRFGTAAVNLYFKKADTTNAGTTGLSDNWLEVAGTTVALEDADQVKALQLIQITPDDSLLELNVNDQLQALSAANPNVVWNVATNESLAENEGWFLMCSPSGIYGDSADDYVWVSFGQVFVLTISLGGVAIFKGWTGAEWVDIMDYSLKDGGVNHLLPFQVTVIPFAKRFISILFTQADPGSSHSKSSINTHASFNVGSAGFLVPLYGPWEPYFDTDLNQWVKTLASPLTIAVRVRNYRYDFILGKVGYSPATDTFYTDPEFLPEIPSWSTVSVVSNGLDGAVEATGGYPTSLLGTVLDGAGSPYNSSSGNASVAVCRLDFSPSGDGTNAGKYTPELWNLRLSYPVNVQTSAYSNIDASTWWELIRFQKTTKPETSRIELKLLEPDRIQYIFLSEGPFRINAIDNSGSTGTLVDGYLTRKTGAIEGPSQILTSQRTGEDMWRRLDGCAVRMDAVEGDEVAATLAEIIKEAGFLDSEVFIDYAGSPELHSITFAKFTNPADVLRANEDASAGEVIRHVVDRYAAQARPPLRVRWDGSKWNIYLGPIFRPSIDTPSYAFVLDDQILEDAGFASEQARYQAQVFKVLGNLEPFCFQPEFNALFARGARDTDNQQGADVASITPYSRVLTDPTYVGYEGAANVKILSPGDLPGATTTDSLHAQLRSYYDVHYNLKELRGFEFSGEWQPEIDVDRFMTIFGYAAKDDATSGESPLFHAGDLISYGVYRIDDLDAELRHDGALPDLGTGMAETLEDAQKNVARRWEWTASYRIVYVGKFLGTWNGHSVPMFTADTNLPS